MSVASFFCIGNGLLREKCGTLKLGVATEIGAVAHRQRAGSRHWLFGDFGHAIAKLVLADLG